MFRFNKRHAQTQNPIEQTFGIMKRRFSIIENRLDHSPQEACRIFLACSCLHNFAMERGDMFVDNGRVVNLNNDVCVDPPEYIERSYNSNFDVGKYVRQEYVCSHLLGKGILFTGNKFLSLQNFIFKSKSVICFLCNSSSHLARSSSICKSLVALSSDFKKTDSAFHICSRCCFVRHISADKY